MGYTREERLDIGKQIYNNEISKSDAAIKYKISEGTARDYMRLYRDVNGLPPKNWIQKEENTVKISIHSFSVFLFHSVFAKSVAGLYSLSMSGLPTG